MPTAAPAPEVTVWSDDRRAGWVGRVLSLMGPAVKPIAVGGPRSAGVDELGRALGCTPGDDFRKLLVDRPAAFILLATMEGVGRDDIAAALAQDTVILTVEPIASTFDDIPAAKTRKISDPSAPAPKMLPPAAGRVVQIPAFQQSPGWTSAADPLEVLGSVRQFGYTSFGPPEFCSLYARLFDAFRVLRSMAGLPESIDASLVGGQPAAADNLRAITGHLTVHARLPNAASAVLQLTDRAAPAERSIQIIGDQGRLRAGGLDYDLVDADGKPLDHQRPAGQGSSFVDLLVWQWNRLLQRPVAPEPTPDDAHLLACCLACHLSALTGQPESPGKLLAVQGLG
ncbi:MAG: hypothetical protein NTW19_13370 [Planctomycetota bacterium]|nr:hypothetical protein [Planctomycetota bacterium]